MKKLAIMQPYFLPYLGYFSLMQASDYFILLDEVQFIRHGWIERNRIINSSDGWQYIKVPLEKHHRNTLIKDILIRSTEDWQKKIFAQLTCYKKKAPYYNDVINLLSSCFDKNYNNKIVNLNANILFEFCNYLNIDCKIDIFSESNIEIDEIRHSGDWAFQITKTMGATEYINPVDGNFLFRKEDFEAENKKLSFLKLNLHEYNQKRPIFEPYLSIIDVLMFNSREQAIDLIKNYRLEN